MDSVPVRNGLRLIDAGIYGGGLGGAEDLLARVADGADCGGRV